MTKRPIGLSLKIRAKTMRGFRNLQEVLTYAYLSSLLRGEGSVCDLRKVIWPPAPYLTPTQASTIPGTVTLGQLP